MSAHRIPLKDRIERNVVVVDSGCWIWAGFVDKDGCARINIEGTARRAHRVSYEVFVGEVPPGMILERACENASCVNWRHLELLSVKDRLLRNVKIAGDDECWQWTASGAPDGQGRIYGHMMVNGILRRAHRLSYELFVGPIPDGLVIDHLCRNPPCVNPKHLEPVTLQENTLRGVGTASRLCHQRQECKKCGGPLTVKGNRKYCAPCLVAYDKLAWQRRKIKEAINGKRRRVRNHSSTQ